jgi:predicted nucleic acid-binding protein
MTPGISSRSERFVEMGLTGYDAVYVALAEELDATWLTFDSKAHSRIAAEHRSADLFAGLPPGLSE